MAFFDKINDLAKNLGDKTSDAIETAKLNSQINTEKNAIAENIKKLGQHFYERGSAGEDFGPEAAEILAAIAGHNEAIAALEAQIVALKTPAPAPEAPEAAPAPAEAVCPSCGTANASGAKFCSICGGKLEAPAAPAPRVCAACGEPLAEGARFCSNCGAKPDAPVV